MNNPKYDCPYCHGSGHAGLNKSTQRIKTCPQCRGHKKLSQHMCEQLRQYNAGFQMWARGCEQLPKAITKVSLSGYMDGRYSYVVEASTRFDTDVHGKTLDPHQIDDDRWHTAAYHASKALGDIINSI